MEFVELVKKVSEQTGEHQEIVALTVLGYIFKDIIVVPEGWDEISPLVRDKIIEMAKEFESEGAET